MNIVIRSFSHTLNRIDEEVHADADVCIVHSSTWELSFSSWILINRNIHIFPFSPSDEETMWKLLSFFSSFSFYSSLSPYFFISILHFFLSYPFKSILYVNKSLIESINIHLLCFYPCCCYCCSWCLLLCREAAFAATEMRLLLRHPFLHPTSTTLLPIIHQWLSVSCREYILFIFRIRKESLWWYAVRSIGVRFSPIPW